MKQINLNPNSITTQLYKWFYRNSKVDDLSSNFLIYSFQVILIYILIIPLYLFIFPYEIYEKCNLHTRKSTINKIYYMIIFYIILFISCIIIISLFSNAYLFIKGYLPFGKNYILYYYIGLMLYDIIAVWYIAYLIKIIYKKIRKKLSKFVYKINWKIKNK